VTPTQQDVRHDFKMLPRYYSQQRIGRLNLGNGDDKQWWRGNTRTTSNIWGGKIVQRGKTSGRLYICFQRARTISFRAGQITCKWVAPPEPPKTTLLLAASVQRYKRSATSGHYPLWVPLMCLWMCTSLISQYQRAALYAHVRATLLT
jgi:hypothetical protein